MESNIKQMLYYIDPATLNYQEWVNVGMALKHEGYSAWDWEEWSRRDSARYHPGECGSKWETFREDGGSIVTGGTIYQMAYERGYTPPIKEEAVALGWDDEISDDYVVVDSEHVEVLPIEQPDGRRWKPVSDLIKYLETLFNDEDIVGYVTKSWVNEDGKHVPTQGSYKKTAGQLIADLRQCKGDIGAVMGDYDQEAGAWIRFNPLDGQGCKNSNVTEFRYALVECDDMNLAKQNALIRELELPVACLVYSGGKSIHAIVKVDAADNKEYRKRVDYLYKICKKNGLIIDEQNKNPSRLSRMPGIKRGKNKQFLIDTNIGKSSWNEWEEWIESVNDDLPDPENLAEVWNDMPSLSPELIKGVLRCGHKMLISGPSKAGKSFALIELVIAMAEGAKWLEWDCKQGRVMYVNLELDRASCLHRFEDVYKAMHLEPKNIGNIDIWNLRGKSVPMDQLAPKLIRRAAKKNYIAIIIDPIYKVITGDENSADQMANFCNQFDKVCTELGCAVIYCHHHSKGAQGGKRSMDRASGSGVFARDPDALLDLIELEVSDTVRDQEENKAVCKFCMTWLKKYGLQEQIPIDDQFSQVRMLEWCRDLLKPQYKQITEELKTVRETAKARTAWRIEGTLREFKRFEPVNLWFDYPVHHWDRTGVLKDVQPDDSKPFFQKGKEARKRKAKSKRDDIHASTLQAYEMLQSLHPDEPVTINELANHFGMTPKGIKNRLKQEESYLKFDNGTVYQVCGEVEAT